MLSVLTHNNTLAIHEHQYEEVLMSTHQNQTTAAFDKLLDTLRETTEVYLDKERGLTQEVDTVEGIRYILHMLSAGIDLYLESDPERPNFVRIISPTRKLMGDNPDAVYYFARIRGDRSYRITGKKTKEAYLSFTLHGRPEDGKLGAAAEPVLADVNDRNLNISPDGSYEVILSPDEHPGNWIQLQPSASSIITRHYFELEGSPAADPDLKVELSIEPIDSSQKREPLHDTIVAPRVADVAAFVRGGTIDMPALFSVSVPFVSPTPNELVEPMGFSASGQDSWGAVDIAYSMAQFKIGPDEALIMEGKFPECAFANVVLLNKHMQTFEFRDRQVSLNRKQTVLEPDGSFRMVIAQSDPEVPNWLDTEGHTEGIIFWRFLLPAEQPAKPETKVVNLSDLGK